MRIGLLAPPWLPVPPARYGGTEGVVDRLARGLDATGHDVVLFTTGDATCPVARRAHLAHAETARMGQAVVEQRHVAHAYEAFEDRDLVHDHTLLGPIYAARFGHLPVVTTAHLPFDAEMRDLYRFTARSARVVAISRAQAADAGDIPIAAVIHHGIEPTEIPFGAGDGGYLLFLGRLAPDKGPGRACEVARAAGWPLKLAARVREPGEGAYFRDEVRPLLGGDIEFVGEVGGADKAALLGGAAALLNPIRWPEPFGLVMIESLAAGTPVLTFAEGAAPEIVEDGVTGFVCADEAAMVAALGRLDELDRRRCRAAVDGPFSARRMVDEHVDLYRKVLAEPRLGPSGTLLAH